MSHVCKKYSVAASIICMKCNNTTKIYHPQSWLVCVPILLNISLDGAVILGMCEISLAKSSVKALAHKSESLANMP